MNPHERLALWQAHLAAAQASLDSVRTRFSGLPEGDIARLRAGWKTAVKSAQGFVKFYEEKIA